MHTLGSSTHTTKTVSQLCFTHPLSFQSPLSAGVTYRHHVHISSFRPCVPIPSRKLRLTTFPKRHISHQRTTPTAHTGCSHAHIGCGHSHAETSSTPPSERSLPARLLYAITDLRHNTRAAVAAALLFCTAAALYLLRLSTLLVRIPLVSCLALTAFPAVTDSIKRIIKSRGRTMDVDILMSIASSICIGTGALFEGALLSTLYVVSHAAEDFVSSSARRALDNLQDITPENALKLPSPHSTTPTTIPVGDVQIGDFILVRSGEIVPCDGVVASGSAFVSMQHITGESNPRSMSVGQFLAAGGRTEDAPLVIRVTQVGAESSLARISRLVTAAKENRPKITKFFDKFGERYARSVLIISVFIAAALPLISIGLSPLIPAISYVGRSGSMARGLGFLVAASPCALLIGGPVAYLAALSCCARKGVLAKSGAKSLEAASRATHVVFDKTGTLTTGKLSLTSASILPDEHGHDVPSRLDDLKIPAEKEFANVISAAAALESGAVHPIASAVRTKATQLGGMLPEVSNVQVIAGQGVEGIVAFDSDEGDMVMTHGRLGRPSYILEQNVVKAISSLTREASMKGETVTVFDFGDTKYLLRLKDEIRGESKKVVHNLTKAGYEVSVLTGDAEGAARLVSTSVGAGATVVSNATPQDKLDFVKDLGEKLGANNKGVLMVGDGVNDAAALAASLVGVACGLSSATAVHAADVVLIRDDLSNIGWFLKKAKATQAVVRQNLIIALGLMVVATMSCVAGSIPLWLAVTLHEGGTVLVGLNGLRLLRDS